MRILLFFISTLAGLTFAHSTPAEEAFVNANPCPGGKNDCFFYRRVLNPNVEGAGRYRHVLIRAEVIREGVQRGEFDVVYKSPDIERCRVRTCRDNIAGSDLQLANSRVATLLNVATMGLYQAGVDFPNCSVCRDERLRGNPLRILLPRPTSGNPLPPYSLVAAKAYMNGLVGSTYRTDCPGSRLLDASQANLLNAQRIFDVPAASIGCLIGQESKWDASSISSTGYKGLPQTDQASIDTMLNRLNPNHGAYDSKLRAMWNSFMGNASTSELKLSNMYNANPERLTAARLQYMAKVSIAYVALSLRQQMNVRVDTARTRYGNAVANRLDNSPTAIAMAMIAYNAGAGNAGDIIPPAAYQGNNPRSPDYNNLAWSQQLLPRANTAVINQAEGYVRKINECQTSSAFVAPPGSPRPRGFRGRCD